MRVRGGVRHTRSQQAERKREFNSSVHALVNRGDSTQPPLVPHVSETALIPTRGGIFAEGDGYSIKEVYNPETDKIETEYIRDKSLTTQQHLRLRRQVPVAGMTLHGRQWDKRFRRLVVVSDTKIVAMSDNTLLKRGNPFAYPTDIKRETSISKRIEADPDSPKFERYDKTLKPVNGTLAEDILAAMEPPPVGKRGRSSGKILSGK